MSLEIATDASTVGGDWSWRLSIADVIEPTPFSKYPGVDRLLMLLEGAQLVIERGGKSAIVPDTDAALAFTGEEEVVCVPSGAGVRDVNFMMRRDRWRGSLHIVRNGCIRADADIVVVHAARGDIGLSAHDEPDLHLLYEEQTLISYGRVEITNKLESAAIVCQMWPIDAA